MRRLHLIWLLPLLLLLGQYGQFRHQLDHYARATASKAPLSSGQQQRPVDADRCELCLAYGHLSHAAKAEDCVPAVRVDLGFHTAPETLHASADPALPAARNRGPPAA